MQDIRVCKVSNKLDETNSENLIVCSIWVDTKLKVYIVKGNNTILFGEEGKEQLQKFAETFDKTLNTYLQESKDIFCGMKSDVDFYVSNTKFYWKRDKWPLGQIYVKPIQDIASLISFTFILIEEYSQNKKILDNVQKEYDSSKLVQSEIIQKLNEFQIIKDQLEDDLYKKFILALNSKKAMIKTLKDKLQKLENSKTIFNQLTDDSDLEEKSNAYSNQKRACKENTNQKLNSKKKKGNETNNVEAIEHNSSKKETLVNVSDSIEEIPSTSSNKVIDKDEETPDLLSGESECDLVLEVDEDKSEDNKIKKYAISVDDSEEEIF